MGRDVGEGNVRLYALIGQLGSPTGPMIPFQERKNTIRRWSTIDCACLLDTHMMMGNRSSSDRLALSYRDIGMSEICPV